jgi:hypothetical protein
MKNLVIAVPVRLSFPKLFAGDGEVNDNGNEKFSANLMVAKEPGVIKPLADLMAKWVAEEFPNEATRPSVQPNFSPIKDGDTWTSRDTGVLKNLKQPEMVGHWIITCGMYKEPGVLGVDGVVLDKPGKVVYGGANAMASVNFSSYNYNGKKGYRCELRNLKMLGTGEPFGQVNDPYADFGGAAPAGSAADDFGGSAADDFGAGATTGGEAPASNGSMFD